MNLKRFYLAATAVVLVALATAVLATWQHPEWRPWVHAEHEDAPLETPAGPTGSRAAAGADADAVSQLVPASPAAVAALFQQTLPDPNGVRQTLAAYKGTPLVVNFWASWCAPCVQEMPELSAMQQAFAGRDVHFIGVGVDSPANVTKFLQNVTVGYPIFVAGFGGAELSRSLGNTLGALPFTVLIDRNGTIRYSKLGVVKSDELRDAIGAM